jgi:hypothetical protein
MPISNGSLVTAIKPGAKERILPDRHVVIFHAKNIIIF